MPQKRSRSFYGKGKLVVYKKRRTYVPRNLARANKGSLTNWGIHRFKRTYQMDEFVAGAAGGRSYDFKLSDLPNFTEFQNLYDQFKLLKWVVKIYYAADSNDVGGTKIETGLLGTALDFNDSTVIGSLNDLREYSTYQETQLIKCHPFTRVFTPKINTMIYKTGVSTGYGVPRRNPFIATVDASIPHFALKCWFQTAPTTTYKITVVGTAYLAFKAVK